MSAGWMNGQIVQHRGCVAPRLGGQGRVSDETAVAAVYFTSREFKNKNSFGPQR